MTRKKVLFLYYELMGYTLAGLKALLQMERDFEIYVVSHDKGNLTPYTFEALEGMNYRRISEFVTANDLLEYSKSIQPDVVFVNSWRAFGSEYMTVSKYFTSLGIPTVCMFDNQWMGTLKQWVGVLTAPFFLRKHFSHMWGCADRQTEFARRLGYPDDRIFQGFYTCDTDLYSSISVDRRGFERVILFVGRFVEVKGIKLLLEAFSEIADDFPEWNLVLVGNGDLDLEETIRKDKVRFEPFKQPELLRESFAKASVFCLPSVFEPWGVVIHEAAAAGLPIVCSDACGAGDVFVEDGVSGVRFSSGNKTELKMALRAVLGKSDADLANMGVKSRLLALENTPEKWSQKFIEIVRSVIT